jgi:hypothetical protein
MHFVRFGFIRRILRSSLAASNEMPWFDFLWSRQAFNSFRIGIEIGTSTVVA